MRTTGDKVANGFAGAQHKVEEPEDDIEEEYPDEKEDEYDAAEAGVPRKGDEGGGMRVTFQV